MKKKFFICLVMIFAIVINLNLNFEKDELPAFSLKLESNQAMAGGIWCADPWGYGITSLIECASCTRVHFRYLWSNEGTCGSGGHIPE